MEWADSAEQAEFRTSVRSFIQNNLPGYYRARADDPRPSGLEADWQEDIVHGSDGPESAPREIGLFFRAEEILSYERSADPWITEP